MKSWRKSKFWYRDKTMCLDPTPVSCSFRFPTYIHWLPMCPFHCICDSWHRRCHHLGCDPDSLLFKLMPKSMFFLTNHSRRKVLHVCDVTSSQSAWRLYTQTGSSAQSAAKPLNHKRRLHAVRNPGLGRLIKQVERSRRGFPKAPTPRPLTSFTYMRY